MASGAGIKDPNPVFRLAALAQLMISGDRGELQPAEIAACLDDPDFEVRRLAVEVLVRDGGAAVNFLLRGLEEDQPLPVRVATASALGRIGAEASPAIDPLCKCVESPDDSLHFHAWFALSKIGPAALPCLKTMLRSPNERVAVAAANSLEMIGTDAGDALEDVKELAETSQSVPFRIACIGAMTRISGDPALGVPALASMLEGDDAQLRKLCIERIGNLGPDGAGAAPSLLPCLGDASGEIRAAAALATAKIGADSAVAVPALTPLLEDPDPEVRASAAMALAHYGPAATPALPALKKLQEDENSRVREIGAAAAERVGKGAVQP